MNCRWNARKGLKNMETDKANTCSKKKAPKLLTTKTMTILRKNRPTEILLPIVVQDLRNRGKNLYAAQGAFSISYISFQFIYPTLSPASCLTQHRVVVVWLLHPFHICTSTLLTYFGIRLLDFGPFCFLFIYFIHSLDFVHQFPLFQRALHNS